MAGTIQTTITTQPVWTNKLCRTVEPNRSWWSQQWIRRIIHVTNWMAGTIQTSSPHDFSAVEDYHACLMKNRLPCGANKRSPNHTACMNKQTLYNRGKDSIFYANRLVTSMYWVVKWASPSLYASAYRMPILKPNERPSLHGRTGPPKKVLQMHADSGLPVSMKAHRQKGQSTTSLPIIKASPCKPHCHGSPFLTRIRFFWPGSNFFFGLGFPL